MCVFVTEGNSRIALAVTRSLGKRGIKVVVGEMSLKSLASASKYCYRTVVYPDPSLYPLEFQRTIVGLMKNAQYRVLMPAGDVTIRSIYPVRTELEKYVKIFLPDEESFERATDKQMLFKLAEESEIPMPKTYFIQNLDDLDKIAAHIEYPVVIKPRYSKVFYKDKWISCLVDYARSADELFKKYKAVHRVAPLPLIQEYIIGQNYGINLLMHHGQLKAVFSKRSIRDKPPSGGVSVMRESIPVDQRMLEYAEKILRLLNWSGVAEVEFKIDPNDNLPKLIEINGRLSGYVQLATECGVDFPYLLYLLSIGESINICLSYKIGLKSRWLLGDLDHLLTILLMRREKLNLQPNYPGRFRSLVHFLNFFETNSKFEVFRWDDPKPFLQEILSYVHETKNKINYVFIN